MRRGFVVFSFVLLVVALIGLGRQNLQLQDKVLSLESKLGRARFEARTWELTSKQTSKFLAAHIDLMEDVLWYLEMETKRTPVETD